MSFPVEVPKRVSDVHAQRTAYCLLLDSLARCTVADRNCCSADGQCLTVEDEMTGEREMEKEEGVQRRVAATNEISWLPLSWCCSAFPLNFGPGRVKMTGWR